MKRAFGKMFWGFLFVLLEIHVFVIDILPDPIGYVLICLGISDLIKQYPIGKKARSLAIILSVVSIPDDIFARKCSIAAAVMVVNICFLIKCHEIDSCLLCVSIAGGNNP